MSSWTKILNKNILTKSMNLMKKETQQTILVFKIFEKFGDTKILVFLFETATQEFQVIKFL